MDNTLIIIIGLFVLSIVSGMLGLGVAFAAIPFLGLFLPDLVHQVHKFRKKRLVCSRAT